MRLQRNDERRGVILMVVLSLLTLFAIVGVAFVLYADSEATSSRVARESETAQRADMEPEQALAFFLGQLIYDVPDDAVGANSALRGHSLARSMYGSNYGNNATPNIFAFNGVGRLHATNAALNSDEYFLVNYTWFQGDGFVRDPERLGTRNAPNANQTNTYVGGNVPYTYPDFNNFFLAAVKADGTVLAPSFHRDWSPFGTLAPNNRNWTKTSNPALKYMVLRPRPAEHPNFPLPEADGRDVKNLVGAPGGNDSIWIYTGAPVMTAPDGTKYTMLFAPLIMDLDGRINLNTAGNILGQINGQNNSHVSNQGWGAWEVNLAKVLYGDNANTPAEYINLILGRNMGDGRTIFGRYGQNGAPSSIGAATSGTAAHFYAPGDGDGKNNNNANQASLRPVPPTGTSPFPTYDPNSYLSGGAELAKHPMLYDVFRSPFFQANNPNNDDRVFRPSDMEPLLRPNAFSQGPVDSGSSALVCDLQRLCPSNFGLNASTPPNSPRYRNLITTLSMDLGVPGLLPYWYNGNGAPYQAAANPLTAPVGNASPFPAPGASFNAPSEFGPDWRAVSAALGRIRLNRPLPPYPHMGTGSMPPYQNQANPPATWGQAYDLTNGNISGQYQAALAARQALAADIYRVLRNVTGVTPPANATPTAQELIPLRWLAQLAVNIVDYIDEDDVCTPFNFYPLSGTSDGTPNAPFVQPQNNGDDASTNTTNQAQNQSGSNNTGANPMYWVFGTELPKVVLNEALAEALNADPAVAQLPTENVKLWIELYNTMQATTLQNVQSQDQNPVPLYMQGSNSSNGGYSPYRVTIAQAPMNQPPPNGAAQLPDASANVLGKSYLAAPFPQSTNDNDFLPTNPNLKNVDGSAVATAGAITPQGFFLIAPKTVNNALYQDPLAAPPVPAKTPVLRTDSVSYSPPANYWQLNSANDERSTGLTVMLRRLANPYLPYQGDPTQANYNPYLTVDYLQNVPIQSNGVTLNNNNPTAPNPLRTYFSRGKRQPYAAYYLGTGNLVYNGYAYNPAGGSPVLNQTGGQQTPGTQVTTTFGAINSPLPKTGAYDWLVHLDRQVISPMELLHVSGYQPWLLTQQFVQPPANAATDNNLPANMFRHYVPWMDNAALPNAPWWVDTNLTGQQTHRLYRLFEFLECGDRATGVWGQGRLPGKVNINTIWDPEILRALVDANPSLGNISDTNVDAITSALLQSRTPNNAPSQNDHPFWPLTAGLQPSGNQFPNGLSVGADTFLRTSNNLFLFQNPNDATAPGGTPPYWHPYLQAQLLTKIYNNVTTRSNAFAVFVTVGFFQVDTDANGQPLAVGGQPYVPGVNGPPRLGPEVGRSEGRHVRHRMFAIIDRTNLALGGTTYTGNNIQVAQGNGTNAPQTVTVSLAATSGTNPFSGAAWSIGAGSTVVFDPGTDNEEVVILQSVGGNLQATFYKNHSQGAAVFVRGNPGPWTLAPYDHRKDPAVVPHYSIID